MNKKNTQRRSFADMQKLATSYVKKAIPSKADALRKSREKAPMILSPGAHSLSGVYARVITIGSISEFDTPMYIFKFEIIDIGTTVNKLKKSSNKDPYIMERIRPHGKSWVIKLPIYDRQCFTALTQAREQIWADQKKNKVNDKFVLTKEDNVLIAKDHLEATRSPRVLRRTEESIEITNNSIIQMSTTGSVSENIEVNSIVRILGIRMENSSGLSVPGKVAKKENIENFRVKFTNIELVSGAMNTSEENLCCLRKAEMKMASVVAEPFTEIPIMALSYADERRYSFAFPQKYYEEILQRHGNENKEYDRTIREPILEIQKTIGYKSTKDLKWFEKKNEVMKYTHGRTNVATCPGSIAVIKDTKEKNKMTILEMYMNSTSSTLEFQFTAVHDLGRTDQERTYHCSMFRDEWIKFGIADPWAFGSFITDASPHFMFHLLPKLKKATPVPSEVPEGETDAPKTYDDPFGDEEERNVKAKAPQKAQSKKSAASEEELDEQSEEESQSEITTGDDDVKDQEDNEVKEAVSDSKDTEMIDNETIQSSVAYACPDVVATVASSGIKVTKEIAAKHLFIFCNEDERADPDKLKEKYVKNKLSIDNTEINVMSIFSDLNPINRTFGCDNHEVLNLSEYTGKVNSLFAQVPARQVYSAKYLKKEGDGPKKKKKKVESQEEDTEDFELVDPDTLVDSYFFIVVTAEDSPTFYEGVLRLLQGTELKAEFDEKDENIKQQHVVVSTSDIRKGCIKKVEESTTELDSAITPELKLLAQIITDPGIHSTAGSPFTKLFAIRNDPEILERLGNMGIVIIDINGSVL